MVLSTTCRQKIQPAAQSTTSWNQHKCFCFNISRAFLFCRLLYTKTAKMIGATWGADFLWVGLLTTLQHCIIHAGLLLYSVLVKSSGNCCCCWWRLQFPYLVPDFISSHSPYWVWSGFDVWLPSWQPSSSSRSVPSFPVVCRVCFGFYATSWLSFRVVPLDRPHCFQL